MFVEWVSHVTTTNANVRVRLLFAVDRVWLRLCVRSFVHTGTRMAHARPIRWLITKAPK